MTALREGSRSTCGVTGSGPNALHTTSRRLEKKAEMRLTKEPSIPAWEGLSCSRVWKEIDGENGLKDEEVQKRAEGTGCAVKGTEIDQGERTPCSHMVKITLLHDIAPTLTGFKRLQTPVPPAFDSTQCLLNQNFP